MLAFDFPFNLEDLPKQMSLRENFQKFDKSQFEELEHLEELVQEIEDSVNLNVRTLESNPESFVFLYNLILFISDNDSTSPLRKSVVGILINVQQQLIPEFQKFNLEPFSITKQDSVLTTEGEAPPQCQDAGTPLERLRADGDCRELVQVTKKVLALSMIFILKGLKFQKKDLSGVKKKKRAIWGVLKQFEDLFGVMYKMTKNGVLLAIVELTDDRFMIKHFMNTMGRFVVSNLVEKPIISLYLLEIFVLVTRHRFFDKNTFLRNVVAALEHESQDIVKFTIKLLRTFLKKKNGAQLNLVVDFSETVMHSLTKKKTFIPEGQFAKNCRLMYSELAECHPAFFYKHYSIFKNFYASDSYFFRNIANEITFFIIEYIDSKMQRASYLQSRRSGSDKDQLGQLDSVKEKYLDLILLRLEDKTVYTRTNTLGIISKILKKQILDPEKVYEVFRIVTQKTMDVSYNVRRKTLVLIQEFLIYIKDVLQLPPRSRVVAMLAKEQKARASRIVEEEGDSEPKDAEGSEYHNRRFRRRERAVQVGEGADAGAASVRLDRRGPGLPQNLPLLQKLPERMHRVPESGQPPGDARDQGRLRALEEGLRAHLGQGALAQTGAPQNLPQNLRRRQRTRDGRVRADRLGTEARLPPETVVRGDLAAIIGAGEGVPLRGEDREVHQFRKPGRHRLPQQSRQPQEKPVPRRVHVGRLTPASSRCTCRAPSPTTFGSSSRSTS